MRISWINRIFLFGLTLFPRLVEPPKIVVIWNHNWTINMIDGKWLWHWHFSDNSSPEWATLNLLQSLIFVSTGSVPYDIFIGVADISGALSRKTVSFYLSIWVSRWKWWWYKMGYIYSPMVFCIQIVYKFNFFTQYIPQTSFLTNPIHSLPNLSLTWHHPAMTRLVVWIFWSYFRAKTLGVSLRFHNLIS